jgi:hypothetical protein
MADRYRTPDSWTVEVVQLEAGKRLRIRHHGFYIADVRSADDLARWIPADELVQPERDTLILASYLLPQVMLQRRILLGGGDGFGRHRADAERCPHGPAAARLG